MPQGAVAVYEICVEGALSPDWAAWFDGVGFRVAETDERVSVTVLTVAAEDPALLHGVLAHIGSLNLRLISVKRKPTG